MAIETNPEQPERKPGKGIYLLPNLFTTAGLFAGFYAIVAAMQTRYDIAAIAIFIAMLTDTLDGRVARMTNTQTRFGAEYDSLSDMVAFGVAPALVIFSWSLHHLGKMGWLAAFIYTACGALRLARFNTQVDTADKRYFQGLPSPAAAAMIAALVWTGVDYGIPNFVTSVIIFFYTVAVAGLMVSNVRYYSFKEFDLKNQVPFVSILVIVLVFAAISIDPPQILLLIFFGYGISGPAFTIWNLRKTRLLKKKSQQPQASSSEPS
jgi:CDP-diacylglycerol---serine O-phosphatidyltransferase